MKSKIQYYMKKQEQYPEKLRNIDNPPKGIYCMGAMPDPSKPTVAIVGARMCSPYGKQQALFFAKSLSEHGVQIISGLARGIDGYSHRGALEGGTPTFAVMGCGLDHCYPAEHKKLQDEIVASGGGILSEYPICTPPLRAYFPQRNRIISGLSDLVLIVEAKEKSGSLITADCALEQGKMVYAVPGRISDTLSHGCNQLLAQGAGVANSVECILEELHIDNTKGGGDKKKIGLATDLKLVYSVLDLTPKSMDQLSAELDMSISALSEYLLQLELGGYAERFGTNSFIRKI